MFLFSFSQLSVYPINLEKFPTNDKLAELLNNKHFVPCGDMDLYSEGFVSPVTLAADPYLLTKKEKKLSYELFNTIQFSFLREEKIIPNAVIKRHLDEYINQINQQENRHVGSKERTELKELIINQLLPSAFSKFNYTSGFIDQKRHLLWVDSASDSKASYFINHLRRVLGGLNVALPQTPESATQLFNNWLASGEGEGNFTLGDSCELRGPEDDPVVLKISKADLSLHVDHTLQHNKNATQLNVIWQDKVSFTVSPDFRLRRVKFLPSFHQELEELAQKSNHKEGNMDYLAALWIAQYRLQVQVLGDAITELFDLLGGVLPPEHQ